MSDLWSLFETANKFIINKSKNAYKVDTFINNTQDIFDYFKPRYQYYKQILSYANSCRYMNIIAKGVICLCPKAQHVGNSNRDTILQMYNLTFGLYYLMQMQNIIQQTQNNLNKNNRLTGAQNTKLRGLYIEIIKNLTDKDFKIINTTSTTLWWVVVKHLEYLGPTFDKINEALVGYKPDNIPNTYNYKAENHQSVNYNNYDKKDLNAGCYDDDKPSGKIREFVLYTHHIMTNFSVDQIVSLALINGKWIKLNYLDLQEAIRRK